MSEEETIQSYCPACKSHNTVFVGAGGYLTCSWAECPEPDFLKAWIQHVENVRGATNKMWKKERDYWKNLAERLMQLPSYNTNVQMVVEAADSDKETNHRANHKPGSELAK
jgi:hypothetical protein